MIKNEHAAAYLKALGHPLRIGIVQELLKGSKKVGELECLLNVSQSNISQHFLLLRMNGIIDFRRKGTAKLYFLKEPERIRCIMDALEVQNQEKCDQ